MTLELRATPEEVMRAVEALQRFGAERNIPDKLMFGLALALEECGCNIVNHALRRDPDQRFHLQVAYRDGFISVELRDGGPAFDPTRAPVESAEPAEDRPPGGWGIPLVRHYMDRIEYRRENNQNILVLTKRVQPPGGGN
jgi:serine/threonine-protein kinase RsbW